MPVSFSIPKSPSRDNYIISTFLGADFTNSPTSVDDTKSPNCVNMIRDVPGKVRKCMGYRKVEQYDDAIYGFHKLRNAENGLIHSGKKLIYEDEEVFTNMNEALSKSWQFGEKLYIIDGKNYLCWDGSDIKEVEDFAYIPTINIACNPSGGGTSYEDLNLLQPGFQEWFYGTAGTTAYQLTFGNLDQKQVTVKVMTSDGVWEDRTEGTHFSVDRTNGIVNFVTAPGVSPVTGEDNIKITAYRTVAGYADRIKKCTIGTQYGINGNLNRLFLSGNDEYRNYDWFSQVDDPSYFMDTSYSNIGSSSSSIIGYSVINSYLATFKDEKENEQNIVLREGKLVNDNEARFSVTGTLQGAAAIARNCFGYIASEPLYFSRLGVYAITSLDTTGEKYGQLRSFYLNGKLLKENNLDKAFALVYKDYYMLFINDCIYILDGLQSISTDKQAPYATRQFAGFYRTNVPAKSAWVDNGVLYFGTSDGRVCAFNTEKNLPSSYNDDGAPIHAIWETPNIDENIFYKNKTFRYFAARISTGVATSVSISAMKKGVWSVLTSKNVSVGYLAFSLLTFSKFSFSSNDSEQVIPIKTRIKKLDKVRFRLENNELNESFGIYDIGVEFVQGNNIK